MGKVGRTEENSPFKGEKNPLQLFLWEKRKIVGRVLSEEREGGGVQTVLKKETRSSSGEKREIHFSKQKGKRRKHAVEFALRGRGKSEKKPWPGVRGISQGGRGRERGEVKKDVYLTFFEPSPKNHGKTETRLVAQEKEGGGRTDARLNKSQIWRREKREEREKGRSGAGTGKRRWGRRSR